MSLNKAKRGRLLPPDAIPQHVAIVMDGNGRWAQRRDLPRSVGHREGVKAVRRVVRACRERDVKVLTLFAFSSENWRRPAQEVSLLMELFLSTLRGEVKNLHKNNVRIRLIGDRSAFADKLQRAIKQAEDLTADNSALILVIAANYGGRWDIVQAARQLLCQAQEQNLSPSDVGAEHLQANLCLPDLPEPDLFIRTGGEQRISNFLLWQLAYTELYFTDQLWPDFDAESLDQALISYTNRQRRFGYTSEQLGQDDNA